jgi:LPXTG-motif cell wall-anchored protein
VKKLAIAGAIAVAAVLATPAIAANADPLPPDGEITIGGVIWDIDEYGIAYGWDAAGTYGGSGYLYYPGFYEDNSDYTYCPDPIGTATMTTEANGDVVIQCAPDEFTNHPGVSATYQIRLTGAASNGHLARSLVTIENTTGVDVPLTDLFGYWYTSPYLAGGGLNFVTNSGETTNAAADDAWFTAGSGAGLSVVQTSAWAKPGSTAAAGLVVSGGANNLWVEYSGVTVPAGGAVRLLQYTNMVIPPTADSAGATSALATAAAQTPEFAAFGTTCGRLEAGLDPSADYIGWGVPAACAPALPATGPADGQFAAFAAGALLLAGVGALVFVRRRRALAGE